MSSTSDAGKTSTEPSKPQSIQRFGMGSMMAIQLVAALLLLVGINIIAYEFGNQVDLTKQMSYTLSDQTKENLKAPVLQSRSAPVKIIAVLDPREFAQIKLESQVDVVSRIQGKLQEYVDKSDQKIIVEYVDPIIEPGKTQELAERYNLTFTESILIIDAFDESRITDDYIKALKQANPDIQEDKLIANAKVELAARHTRVLRAKELFYADFNRIYDQHFVAGWKDESEITTNLLSAIEGRSKKVYFLYDKCRLDSKLGGKAPWEYIRDVYRGQNIQLVKLSLAEAKKIPDDADGIVLISPVVDFTEKEILVLRDYWEVRVRSSILITLDPEVYLPKLYSYLFRSSGVKPMKNRLVTLENNQVMVNAEVEILQGPQVNGDLGAKSTTFDGASQSIMIEKTTYAGSNVEAFPLIKAAPNWWGETKFGEQSIAFDERYDHSGTLFLAVGVTRGKMNNQLTAPLVSKMVMLGNSDFLSSQNIREEQSKYIGQVGNWLVGREPLMNIKQHANYQRKVFIAQGHAGFLSNLFIIFIPSFALLITGFVWNHRRS